MNFMKPTLLAGFLIVMATTLFGAVGHADQTNTFAITADTPWVVATNEPESVQRALLDVQGDWYKVLGHRPIVLNEPPTNFAGPVIYLGTKGPWLKDLVKEPSSGAESFILRAQRAPTGRQALVATGADVRGAIYAAYALSEEILSVDPWYFWVDKEPAFRGRVEVAGDFNKSSGSPTFKYRGWFINDEDLLGGYAPDPLRENVFSLEMLDRICETILRLRGNMIVPGTFNFPDERCWELASRRGLVLNMHHILVVGLNTYRWPKDVPFSYSKHPDIMERYWRECIAAFKGREVVWTVGYRGKFDRPFWTDEPELNTPEARGAVITAAIAKQVELIRAADPNAMIIANLWMEGADMMHAGHLKLPEGVVQVWPDDGTGIIRDNDMVKVGQGTYYHTAMLNGTANQLSEMVNPARISHELGRFARAGATNFFLVNVSDVRPVPLSTDFAMRLAWNAAPWLARSDSENQEAFLTDWSRRQFGPQLAEDIAAIYARYFDIPYQRADQRKGDNAAHSMLRKLANTMVPRLQVGKPPSAAAQKSIGDAQQFAATNRVYVEQLVAAATALEPRVPAERRDFFQANVLTPFSIHLYSLEMLESYCKAMTAYGENQKPQAIAALEQSLAATDQLFAVMRRAETGKWARWYFGERFVGLEANRDRMRVALALLRGEPEPPVHASFGYPELYQYQEPFSPNFPLLYPRLPESKP